MINYEELISQLGECCITDCGICKKDECLVGYCKQSLTSCLKQKDEFLDGGMEGIPYNDSKIYDNDSIINSLASLLLQCRNCNVYHDDECIINITRSSLEIILLGDYQDYKGSTLVYFNDLKSVNKEIADKVLASFQQKKSAS
ncbi:hypothetical protein BHF68_13245 [Desulfuribacillus alkaliarsenatis]|uniref:Uncharacterized protein n=2 Tax=Desulfuribacillus alkaliarsenatis TaxID=766136 RepID=A0A1E5G431_9FIRM|nr:hypothetical protein BHF68_13245 [Desulfuribacillus alkaliarsenatis]